MNRFKMAVQFGLIGICIGSATFLISLLNYKQSLVTPSQIISLFIASGLVGELSMIFKFKRFQFIPRLVIHYLGTTLIMVAFGAYNHFIDNWWALGSFVESVTVAYVIISVVQYIMNIRYANNVNQLIKARKKDRH
ncbi:DUF3021 domain-containing protein [Nicoliella spurrieriana]|uniref:DUF3021 domain-containing protein n=1 Tax=Nicoliella spurrieriana TaxID=2925830 RepID=A0A976RT67_9LACO|nr:DUF3021 domain-containing protein [Nicoliella spurrieriana]UQS87353.1 DUF3021 domain-containing protein [Nicoliella spurrieriana]